MHLSKGNDKDNMHDMFLKDRRPSPVGEKNSASKLTESEVKEIFEEVCKGSKSLRAIGREFGTNVNNVIAIRDGITWSHVTGVEKNYDRLVFKPANN